MPWPSATTSNRGPVLVACTCRVTLLVGGCDHQTAASSLVGRVPCYLAPARSATTRNSWASSTAPGACLGHEPGDTKGQQRSQADSRDLAMTSATLWSSGDHDGMPYMACKRSDGQRASAHAAAPHGGPTMVDQARLQWNRARWLIVEQAGTGRSPWRKHATRGDSLGGSERGSGWLHPANPQRAKQASGDRADHGGTDPGDPPSIDAVDQGRRIHPAGGLEGGGLPRAQLLCPRHLAGAGRSPVPLPGHAVRPSRGPWPFRLHPTLSDTSAADTAAVDR